MVIGILFVLFLVFWCLILYCALDAGNTPESGALSDREQLEYIRRWKEKRQNRTRRSKSKYL